MTAASRAKGRRVQTEGLALLRHHGWEVVETTAGQTVEDACCMDPQGDWWAELDAEPQTGVCATCRKPVTRRALWCDQACAARWLEGAG